MKPPVLEGALASAVVVLEPSSELVSVLVAEEASVVVVAEPESSVLEPVSEDESPVLVAVLVSEVAVD
jgi:hypothetical protein